MTNRSNTRPTPAARAPTAVMLLIGTLGAYAPPECAAEGPSDLTRPSAEERLAIHGQVTYVEQETNAFNAPYGGQHSLTPSNGRETVSATLFLGGRLWSGAEAWVNPEIDQGFGLDDTQGVAGFPSGEAYKVGSKSPYFRMPRAFIRQTLGTGGERELVAGAANQLRGSRDRDRWVFTLGKFAVTDVFDTNQYAHDPRTDFLNWVAVDSGCFDYAADAWGFTVGVAAERYLGSWTYRAGVFALSEVPNSETLDHGFHQFQMVAEIEKRYRLFGQTGRALLTVFDSRGRMGLLADAISLAQATGNTPDTADVRQFRSRLGASLSLEQPVTEEIGLFARISKAQGNVEAYEFTDVDRSLAVGASLKGAGWRRPSDTFGIAAIANRISAERQEYLNLGGLGILVGDGKLPHPGAEQIVETYYALAPLSWARLSLDYQWVRNPAYNTDRGPVSILAVRVHAQF